MLESSVVRDTSSRPQDGLYGDGIALLSLFLPATAAVANSRIDNSARAGLASFGASLALEGSRIRCAAFALAGESSASQSFHFMDHGNNLCGCPHADGSCQVVSAGLVAPEPL